MNMNLVESSIIQALNQVTKDWQSGELVNTNRNWTRHIKNLLGAIGKGAGYEVCSNGCGETFEPEWLYDMVWYENDADGYLKNIPFIMESEWIPSLTEIRYDFEKLLVSNAQLKLMICSPAQDQIEHICTYFHRALKTYSTNGKFLIAILDDYGSGLFVSPNWESGQGTTVLENWIDVSFFKSQKESMLG